MDNLTKAETREELLTKAVNGQAETAQELVTKAQPAQSVDGMIARWKSDAPLVHTNLACEGSAGRVLFSKIMNQSDFAMADKLHDVMEVVGFAVHLITIASLEEGELKDMERLILMLADGTTVSTCSNCFGNTFVCLAKMAGPGRWDPPLLIKAVGRKGKAGRTYYECHELARDESSVKIAPPVKQAKPSK